MCCYSIFGFSGDEQPEHFLSHCVKFWKKIQTPNQPWTTGLNNSDSVPTPSHPDQEVGDLPIWPGINWMTSGANCTQTRPSASRKLPRELSWALELSPELWESPVSVQKTVQVGGPSPHGCSKTMESCSLSAKSGPSAREEEPHVKHCFRWWNLDPFQWPCLKAVNLSVDWSWPTQIPESASGKSNHQGHACPF